MSAAEAAAPLSDTELPALFSGWGQVSRILIAVSGGPDSTALLHLALRWRATLPEGPDLIAATVDHGLREASRAEAEAVAAACATLGVPHLILPWQGEKPARGVQEAARDARFRLLLSAAAEAGAEAVALGHHLDDQAETVLFRLARGSGLTGLAAMRPRRMQAGCAVLRPLLDVPKARLVATLEAAGIAYVRDPTNADTRFARPRLRALAPALVAEGLDARRLAGFARRMARADAALEAATDAACRVVSRAPWGEGGAVRLDAAGLQALPEEIALRLLSRAVARLGTEGEAELAKLEALAAAVHAATAPGAAPFRRTLAGALVSVQGGEVSVKVSPPRRVPAPLASNSSVAGTRVLGKTGDDT